MIFYILFVVGGVDGVKFFAQGGYFLYERHITVAFVVCSRFQLLVQCVDPCFHLVQMCESLCCFGKHRSAVFRHQMLWKIGYHAVFLGPIPTTGRLSDPCQNLE